MALPVIAVPLIVRLVIGLAAAAFALGASLIAAGHKGDEAAEKEKDEKKE